MRKLSFLGMLVELLALAPLLMAGRCGLEEPINSSNASLLPDGRIVLLRDGGGSIPTGDQLFLMSPDGTASTLVANSLANIDYAAVSPTGRQIVFTEATSVGDELFAVDLPRRRVTHIGKGRNPVWSRDGRLFAFVREELVRDARRDYVFISDVSGARIIRATAGSDFSWAPDSRRIVVPVQGDSISVLLVGLTSGSSVREIAVDTGTIADPAWSPNGRWIAFHHYKGDSGGVRVVDAKSKRTRTLQLPGVPRGPLAWSPDGNQLVVTSWLDSAGVAYLIRLDRHQTIQLDRIDAQNTRLSDPVWSRRGTRVALVARSVGGEAMALRIVSADGTGARVVSRVCGAEPRAQWSRHDSTLLFAGNCDGANELYLARTDRAEITRLTWGARMSLEPAWLPDGRLTFTRFADGRTPVVTIASSVAVGERKLFMGRKASWSPNGGVVAYVNSGPEERTSEGTVRKPWPIFLADSDGSNSRPLVRARWWRSDSARASSPTWSPDQKRIAFSAELPGSTSGIYVVDVATGQPVRLTPNDTASTDPAWSPDGGHIAYTQERDTATGSMQIWVMETHGGRRTALTNESMSAGQATWSPDARYIAFAAADSGIGIYIMDANGSGVRRITSSGGIDWAPAWSPDGRWIAFVSENGGSANIWLVRPDGTGLHRVTSPRAASSDCSAIHHHHEPASGELRHRTNRRRGDGDGLHQYSPCEMRSRSDC